ncbi:MAG: hypothetical protein ACR2H3_10370 [Acidimicrobiales bacterium]
MATESAPRRLLPRRRSDAVEEETDSDSGRRARVSAMLERLAPAIDVDGPRVRLGLAWASLTLILAATTTVGLAVVLAGASMAAAGQAARSWRRSDVKPWRPVAVLGAALLPLGAAVGPLGVALVAAGIVVAAVIGHRSLDTGDGLRTAAIALLFGMAGASVVLLRTEVGVVAVLAFLFTVHVWDASAFVVGSGANNRWEGHLAAGASTAAVTLFVAAMLVPPFRGLSPVVLGLVVGLLGPVGPYVGSMVLGDPTRRAPAVRRLDVLLVAAPVWAVAAAVLLG